jgi:hypothetical protein
MTYTNPNDLTPEEDLFNTGQGEDQPLHEISGMTTGELQDGTSVTVAVADKNNKENRDGTGELAISYTDISNKTHYEVIDFSKTYAKEKPTDPDRTANLGGVGFEDMDWRDDGTPGGTYYLMDEGGGKNGDYKPPSYFTAKLVTRPDGRHEMQLTGGPFILDVPSKEYSTPWGEKDGVKCANGAEGFAIDKDGNMYVGMQSGNIYKGTLQADGTYEWGTEPIIRTGYNDLSALNFDSEGNMIVGFGSNSWGQRDGTWGDNKNHVITYLNPDAYNSQLTQIMQERSQSGGRNADQFKTDWEVISNTKVEDLFDVESIYQDDQGNIIAGSDNDGKSHDENGVALNNVVNTTINT